MRVNPGTLEATPPTSSTLKDQDDAQLVELFRSGHDSAFATIVDRYEEPLRRYCGRLLDGDRAEEVVQQAFTKTFIWLRKDDREMHLRAWLYRLTHNLACDARKKKSIANGQLDHDRDAAYVSVVEPPEVFESREQLKNLVGAIDQLPKRQRAVLLLSALEGHSTEEIARRMRLRPGNVYQLLHRARTQLRATHAAQQ
jgi:RNA polymerase sigma factor (sigma-70 family)